jgi:hypothetical protein
MVGHVNETQIPPVTPEGWLVEAFPAEWDPAAPAPLKTVQVDNGITLALLPERFYLVVQSAAMRRLTETTAVVIEFETDKSGVAVTRIFGAGEHWLSHLSEVMTEFPTYHWVPESVQKTLAFMANRGVLTKLGPLITELSIPRRDAGASPGGVAGVQRRRQITPEHLSEVAAIYLEADSRGEPPTRAVQAAFDVSHSTAAKWVGKARHVGLLPPATGQDS